MCPNSTHPRRRSPSGRTFRSARTSWPCTRRRHTRCPAGSRRHHRSRSGRPRLEDTWSSDRRPTPRAPRRRPSRTRCRIRRSSGRALGRRTPPHSRCRRGCRRHRTTFHRPHQRTCRASRSSTGPAVVSARAVGIDRAAHLLDATVRQWREAAVAAVAVLARRARDRAREAVQRIGVAVDAARSAAGPRAARRQHARLSEPVRRAARSGHDARPRTRGAQRTDRAACAAVRRIERGVHARARAAHAVVTEIEAAHRAVGHARAGHALTARAVRAHRAGRAPRARALVTPHGSARRTDARAPGRADMSAPTAVAIVRAEVGLRAASPVAARAARAVGQGAEGVDAREVTARDDPGARRVLAAATATVPAGAADLTAPAAARVVAREIHASAVAAPARLSRAERAGPADRTEERGVRARVGTRTGIGRRTIFRRRVGACVRRCVGACVRTRGVHPDVANHHRVSPGIAARGVERGIVRRAVRARAAGRHQREPHPTEPRTRAHHVRVSATRMTGTTPVGHRSPWPGGPSALRPQQAPREGGAHRRRCPAHVHRRRPS